MGLINQWVAETQRKSDERAARWQERHRELARTGQLTFMDRWAAHAQRKSDEQAAQWQERQHEKALSGRTTVMDRWAAHAQRKSDEAAARWLELEPLYQLLASGPAYGPAGSRAVIFVEATGDFLTSRRITKEGTLLPTGGNISPGGAGGGALIGLAYLLILLTIWLAFRRSYTVHVHMNGYLGKMHVRLPNQLTAYRAAAELASRFEAEGPGALESWRADVMARIN